MTVGAETYRGQRRPNFNLLHLLPFNNVVEEDATVKSGATQEQVVDRAESDARAYIVVSGELKAQRVGLRCCRIYWCTPIFILGDDLL